MLSLNNISFEFGGRYLYKEATWQINPGEKIGLIGANGTGKSTLLRIINGEYSLESGNISRLKNLSLGFLNQDLLSYDSEKNILDVAMEAFSDQLKLHEEIEDILARLEHDHSEELLHQLHDKQTAYEAADGYNLQYKAEQLLEGLGFSTTDLKRPLTTFSGGWRMRVMLAKIMLQQPDILMLDEPTNHLDLPSILWIENYLREYKGTVIIVSHDRYFLDKVIDLTAEIANQKITLYKGNYSFYLEEKSVRDELQQNQFENQQQYIKEQEKLINRFRAKASKAKMAQSRIKKLDKLERIEEVGSSNATVKIKFDIGKQPGKVIAKLDIKEKSYDKLKIFEKTECVIERGDKIALIGANGRGKSTLLRMINGSEQFDGKLESGYNVITSFYAQHQLESLNLQNDMMQELQDFAPAETDVRLRAVLGSFLFSGDDVFKKIKVLSGGEKSRVALAKTILSKANFLILDEPTNHLDMQTVNTLIQVLQEFEGTFIVVSHDRYFISQIANKIWWIENHQLKEYPGDYEEYEYSLERKAKTQADNLKQQKKKETEKPKEKKESQPSDEQRKQKKKLQNRFQSLEENVAKLKSEKSSLEHQLSLPEIYENQAKFAAMLLRFNEVEKKIEEASKEWEQVFEQLSGME
ncbi:MAG: ABC-F family ATP-binding cassette domain-containing protein [Bacteroidetes bacterium]|nr:ABC-F family ATP-binding cassette domain-containing protein [Bacteroidota bacterium]